MEEQRYFGECEVCGKPATNMVADMYRWDNYDTGWVEFAAGLRHRYCDEHNRPSVETNISMSPIGWANLTKEEKQNYGKRK